MHCNVIPDVRSGGVHSTTFDPELRNERLTLISFMGFPAILNALQPFQICICNRKNSKLIFFNGPQLMGKRLMANLHASLNSKYKSRISKISTRCQIQVVYSYNHLPPDVRSWRGSIATATCHQMSDLWGLHSIQDLTIFEVLLLYDTLSALLYIPDVYY